MYKISDFKNLGLYLEKPGGEECEVNDGDIIVDPEIPSKAKRLLNNTGGSTHGGDESRQDSAVITSLLSAGYSPPDVYATFISSARGIDASKRKEGHLEDYVQRTIEKAIGFLKFKEKEEMIKVDFSNVKTTTTKSGLVISMGHEIHTEKTRWIWPSYIPAGKLTIFAGDPGMGKSTIIIDLLARISRGTFLPSGARSVTGSSLIISAEDSAEDTISARLIAAGANLEKVGVIRAINSDDTTKLISFPRDLIHLKDELSARGCRILVIDPLDAFVDAATDTHSNHDMRLILHALEQVAEETGTAIIVISHLNKKEDSSALYRIGGSIGIIAAARSVLAVTKLEDNSRVLYSLKGNLTIRPPSICYETRSIKKVKSEAYTWLGEQIVHSSGIRWLGEVDYDPSAKRNLIATAESKVAEEIYLFLNQLLTEGEIEVELVYSEAKNAGINKSHLNKVKTSMGIRTTKRNGSWFWGLPETE